MAIIGPGGAGKTTLARELAEALRIEVVQLDKLFWRPGWEKTSPDECEQVQQTALSGDAWIADSAAPRALRARLDAADTVVFLDLPLRLCALRAFLRRIRTRGRPRGELAAGCVPARIDRALVRYLSYVWRYRRELRPQFLAELDRLSNEHRIVHLRTRDEVQRFVESVRQLHPGGLDRVVSPRPDSGSTDEPARDAGVEAPLARTSV